MVVSVLLGKSQPQAALDSAAQQVNQALAGKLTVTAGSVARAGGPATARRRGAPGAGLRAVHRLGVRHARRRDHRAVRRGADRLVGGDVLPAVHAALAEHAVRRPVELPADDPRPGRGAGDTAHAGLHRAVRARDHGRGTVPGRGDEPEDPRHLGLPDRRLRDDGDLHDQRGDRVHLAVRPVLRDRELRASAGSACRSSSSSTRRPRRCT